VFRSCVKSIFLTGRLINRLLMSYTLNIQVQWYDDHRLTSFSFILWFSQRSPLRFHISRTPIAYWHAVTLPAPQQRRAICLSEHVATVRTTQFPSSRFIFRLAERCCTASPALLCCWSPYPLSRQSVKWHNINSGKRFCLFLFKTPLNTKIRIESLYQMGHKLCMLSSSSAYRNRNEFDWGLP
jgi:hypothetical protein